MLRNASAIIAEREALRKGIEHLTVLFPTEVSSFDFQVENSGRTVQYSLNAQSLRLFGLHSDVNNVHRAGANRLQNKQKYFVADSSFTADGGLLYGLVVCNSSNTRQLGCVFQDMEPPKLSSNLRKSSDMQKPVQRVRFSKAVARHTKKSRHRLK